MKMFDKRFIRKDRYFKIVHPIFKDVCNKYENLIKSYSFVKYNISDIEIVYQIEDDFIFYIGLRENFNSYNEDTDKKAHAYDFHEGDVTMMYHVHMEELTENRIFKFNQEVFKEQFENADYFLNINIFKGSEIISPLVNYVDKHLIGLNLKARVLSWEGWKYYFIVFEITSAEQNKSFAIWGTSNQDFHIQALNKCKKVEEILHKKAAEIRGIRMSSQSTYGILFDENIGAVANQIINKSYKNKDSLYKNIKYFIVEKNIKQKSNILIECKDILKNALNNHYDNYERGAYLEPVVKWKSEYLVKTLCEKIYGYQNVIYQHRPYFLHSNFGQLSYDIYLPKLKIAIEYQGKQHFEPVEFFGGEKSYKDQAVRDKLKLELSIRQGVKLIYINYWEKITETLIKDKIKEKL